MANVDEKDTQHATEQIANTFNRAVRECLVTLEKAVLEAKTYTLPSRIVESQQAHIARLQKLHDSLLSGAKNPLGEFNWDWL